MYIVKGKHVKDETTHRLATCETIKEARDWKERFEATRHFEYPNIWIDREEG